MTYKRCINDGITRFVHVHPEQFEVSLIFAFSRRTLPLEKFSTKIFPDFLSWFRLLSGQNIDSSWLVRSLFPLFYPYDHLKEVSEDVDGVGNGDIALFLWFVKVQLTRHLRNFRIMSHHIGGTGAISSKFHKFWTGGFVWLKREKLFDDSNQKFRLVETF